MGLLQKLRDFGQRARGVRHGGDRPSTVNRAGFKITAPDTGAEWTPGEFIDLHWTSTGPVRNPLEIALVKGGPDGNERPLLTIASGVDPGTGEWTIEVPDMEPGSDYRLLFANADPLTVYSAEITITEPA